MENKEKKKKKFNLFNAFYGKERKEDSLVDDIDETRGIKNYFKILLRYFGNIFSLNIYAVIGNFPIFFIMLALSENLHKGTTAPASSLFGPLYGSMQLGAVSPSVTSLFGAYGIQTHVSIWTPVAYAFLIGGIVLLLFTFGPVMTGITYNMRNIVKREPLFLWDDFKYAIKKNLRQSIIIGIMDLLILSLLSYNIYFYYLNVTAIGSYFYSVMFWGAIVMMFLYLFMRNYIYLLLVTFDLSIFKIIKNALIFSILGFGRNAAATLAKGFFIIFNIALAVVFLPLGIILPFVITVGLCIYTSVYVAWPKISKIMIEPYLN